MAPTSERAGGNLGHPRPAAPAHAAFVAPPAACLPCIPQTPCHPAAAPTPPGLRHNPASCHTPLNAPRSPPQRTLDDRASLASDRDSLRERANSLLHQLDRVQARLATAEAAAALQREALEASNTRGAALASEAMEVQRLNRALQLRLEKAESKREKAEAARAEAESKAAEAAARWEREVAAAAERLQQAEARAAALARQRA
jgi:hypothetical protein